MPVIGVIGDSNSEQPQIANVADRWCYKLIQSLEPGATVTTWNTPMYSGGTAGLHNTFATPHYVIRNCGVSSNNTGSMQTRFNADILAHPMDALIFLAGFIDCSTQDIETFTKPKMLDMTARAAARGIRVIIALTPPRTGASQALLDTDIAYRAWLTDLAATNDWPLLDFCTPLEATPGTGVANASLMLDNAHFNEAGCTLVAAVAAADPTIYGPRGDNRIGVVTLQPGATGRDTNTVSNAATTNYGAGSTSQVGDASGSVSQANMLFLAFDELLPLIPSGATVADTIVSLFEWSANYVTLTSADVTMHRLLRPWTEAGATHNTYDGANPWTTPGARGDGTDRVAAASATLTMDGTFANDFVFWRAVGLSADINAMKAAGVNDGWMFDSTGNLAGTTARATNYFYLSEHGTAGPRPKISLLYTLPPLRTPRVLPIPIGV